MVSLNEKEKAFLLEQYKIYIETADKVSERRDRTNRFYISLLSILIALPTLSNKIGILNEQFIVYILCIFGIVLCCLWIISIKSYKKLNSGKFKVIQDMENFLPYPCFNREWEILKKEESYIQLTHIEQLLPILVIFIFLGLLLYS